MFQSYVKSTGGCTPKMASCEDHDQPLGLRYPIFRQTYMEMLKVGIV